MMQAILKKHLKKNKKGFTLVEVVVVLVILAILAAIAVPALTGYITDAKERALVTEARTVLVALQQMASTDKDDNNVTTHGQSTSATQASYFAGTGPYTLRDVTSAGKFQKLTGLTTGARVTAITIDGNDTVTAFDYQKDVNGKVVKYDGSKFTVQK